MTDREQFAEQNEMSMDFVNWFFDKKKEACGNAWFIMAAAMWEGWEGLANREAQPVEWGSPKTVGQMIGQLKTLDPAMETTALLRMPPDILDGNAVRQVPISISFEKLNGQWLAPYKGEGRKVLAFWAKADHREEGERGDLLTTPPAPAVPDGYKLMPLEITDEIGEAIAMEARCCGGIALDIYEAALAAAPEGGNG